MNTSERRAALIAQCARQREEAAAEVRALLQPVSSGAALKLPLTIATVVIGMIAARSGGRAMPIVAAGLGLWKVVRKVLRLLRK
ncbi:MAG: hypothetical protein JWP34_1620 [Massilia sp.]|nr:hypothetical protein [Massilia sp.]